MADRLKIVLHGDGGDLAARAFLRVVRETLTILERLAKRPASGQWLIGDLSRENPASIELVKHDHPAPEATLFVEGLRQLESGVAAPAGFSEDALTHVRKLTGTLDDGVSSLVFVNGNANPVRVSHAAAATIGRVKPPPTYTAITSLEGRLEGINVHGRAEFHIYDPITDEPIKCIFDAKDAEKLGRLLTHRIVVTGLATFNRDHMPTKIVAESWKEIGRDAISTDELHAAGLRVDDDRPSEEIIRSLRRLDG